MWKATQQIVLSLMNATQKVNIFKTTKKIALKMSEPIFSVYWEQRKSDTETNLKLTFSPQPKAVLIYIYIYILLSDLISVNSSLSIIE